MANSFGLPLQAVLQILAPFQVESMNLLRNGYHPFPSVRQGLETISWLKRPKKSKRELPKEACSQESLSSFTPYSQVVHKIPLKFNRKGPMKNIMRGPVKDPREMPKEKDTKEIAA